LIRIKFFVEFELFPYLGQLNFNLLIINILKSFFDQIAEILDKTPETFKQI